MSDDVVRVFAYGSNLSTRRLRARTPSARALCVAALAGYALRFHKRGADGSAKADAFRTGDAEDRVWGVVWEVAADELPALSEVEAGYDLCEVELRTRDGARLRAHTYCANAAAIDAGCVAFDWYVEYIREGVLEHGLPADCVRALEGVPRVPDPIRERARANARKRDGR